MWSIETDTGSYEGEKLNAIIGRMAYYTVENDYFTPTIKYVMFFTNQNEQFVSDLGIEFLQENLEARIDEVRERILDMAEYIREQRLCTII